MRASEAFQGNDSAPLPEMPDLCRQFFIVGDDNAPVIGRQVLFGVERKTTDVTDSSSHTPFVGCERRLANVFNEGNFAIARQSDNWIHIAKQAVEVDRNDGSGAFGDNGSSIVSAVIFPVRTSTSGNTALAPWEMMPATEP